MIKTARKLLTVLIAMFLCISLMGVCFADAYSEYLNAYTALIGNGRLDADIKAHVSMADATSDYSGNMKVDFGKNLMMYDMACGDMKISTFTDGKTIYTESNGKKTCFSMDKSSDSGRTAPAGNSEAPEFTVQDFINNFSSVLEPGKIAELGLLSPINGAVVSSTDKSGNNYKLNISDSLAKVFLNTMSGQVMEGDAVTFTDMKNLGYTATIENNVVTATSYSGDVSVHVPGSLISTGSDADYSLSFVIDISFNNPGSEPEFQLPSTDGYEESDPMAVK